MALSAAQIVTRACEIAHAPGYTVQGQQFLNAILSDLCQTYDFAVARGLFTFTFDPQLAGSMIGGQNIGASGPYPLPNDYLRTSGSSGSEGTQKSTFWLLNGVPYPMVPCDLAEFDMQVQQVGISAFPWLWATDMAQRKVAQTTSGTLNTSTIIGNLVDPNGIRVGMTVLGPGIPYNTTVISLSGGPPVNTVILSQASEFSAPDIPLTFGYPAVGYAYPPPSGGFAVTLRYQRQMPDIIFQAAAGGATINSDQPPWFPNQRYLIQQVAGMVMETTDDARAPQYLGSADGIGAEAILDKYLKMKDDDTNRSKVVGLDRRRFGSNWNRLKTTKTVGWP